MKIWHKETTVWNTVEWTENKTDETKKGANEDEKGYKETLTKGREMTQRTIKVNT